LASVGSTLNLPAHRAIEAAAGKAALAAGALALPPGPLGWATIAPADDLFMTRPASRKPRRPAAALPDVAPKKAPTQSRAVETYERILATAA
ncbi:hypothetical protein ABXT13_13355, partial [Staphylococcus caprae]|uniref:hypothetical protein n=1 Tax=Staphylococcus caprae TaxID=29380 RepID=UPI003394AA8F